MLTALPHLTQVIRALAILKPDEPIDAKTLADLIDSVPKQVKELPFEKLHIEPEPTSPKLELTSTTTSTS